MPVLKRWKLELRSIFEGGFSQLKYRQNVSTVSKSPMTVSPASYSPDSVGMGCVASVLVGLAG